MFGAVLLAAASVIFMFLRFLLAVSNDLLAKRLFGTGCGS